jgi:hypothetical protein
MIRPRSPLLLFALALAAPAFAQNSLVGAWRPETYTLKDGAEKEVTGLIFFTERDWTVLFFTKDGKGGLSQGSGEGGTYTLDGERLVFKHLYHMSGGSTPLKMSAKSDKDAELEPCTVEVEGEILTIHFPSGNRMRFRRSSG